MYKNKMTVENHTHRKTQSQQISDFLAREDLRYQSFVLPDGSTTPGHDRSYLNPYIFDESANGSTLLDIGSYLGYFCVEAMQRGARKAVGIEPEVESIRQAREIARLCNVEPNYLCGDFEEWDFGEETFDTVLCLNVMHHMFDPVGALRKMIGLARRRIVIEFAQPRFWHLLGLSLSQRRVGVNSLPLLLLGEVRKSRDVLSRSFLITSKAFEVLFNQHTGLFEPVTIHASPFKDRGILVANKRRIKHLVVIAGPTASGKSTLLLRLTSDPALRARLGLKSNDIHVQHTGREELPTGEVPAVLFHYDILRPYLRSIRAYHRDPASDYLKASEKITLVTLMTPKSELQRRLKKSAGVDDPSTKTKLNKRHQTLYERYGEDRFLETWYDAWFTYCSRYPQIQDSLLYVTEGGEGTFKPAEDWRGEFARLHR